MNRRHLDLAALAAVLFALGIALMPFGWRGPRASGSCSPAIVAAWQTRQVPFWSTSIDETNQRRGQMMSVPTSCAQPARARLETSGTLLGLVLVGEVAGRRILRGVGVKS